MTCPSCQSPAKKLIAGVCDRCRKSFELAHKKKMDTEWKPEDFKYYEPDPAVVHSPIMDFEDAVRHDEREKRSDEISFFKRGMRLLVQYEGNRMLAEHAYCLAHGWTDLIGCDTAVDVAKKLFGDGKKKAAVNKAVKHFRECLNIKHMPGQRSDEGCEAMARARKEQLK